MTLVDKRLLATTFVESVVVGGGLTRNITDPSNPIVDLNIATQAEAEAGTNNIRPTTPFRVAQAIAKLSPPTDMAPLALAIADLQGGRFSMKGGIADAFDDETGTFYGSVAGNDSFTKFLLHFDGADASTLFQNSAAGGLGIATASGDTKVVTAYSQFGGSSAYFDGTTDGITLTESSGDLTFGTGDFAIDFWYRPFVLAASQYIIDFRPSGAGSPYPTLYMNSGVVTYYTNGTNRIAASAPLVVGVWYHIALTRTSSVTKLFINGVQQASDYADATNYLSPGTIFLGKYFDGSYSLNGWMDEFRVSKGAGRWSANFTPPTAPYGVATVAGSANLNYNSTLDYYGPTLTVGTDQTATHTSATASGNTVSASTFLSPFDPWKAFDKVVGGTAGAGNWITNVITTGWLQYQFGSAKTIGSYTIRSGVAYQTRAPLAWTLQGSNTGAFAGEQVIVDTRTGQNGWGSGGTVVTYTVANPGLYTYYRLNVTANNGDAGYVQIDEMTLIAANIINNMTLVSNFITAAAVPTSARVNIQIDTTDTPTPNTDFSMEVSRDGGVTYTVATLTLANSFGTIKTYENTDINISAQPSGTSMVWRFKTLTNKNIPITGVVLQWK